MAIKRIDKKDVTEEISDVYNMLIQCKLIFDLEDEEIANEMQRKMDRTMKRIEEQRQGK